MGYTIYKTDGTIFFQSTKDEQFFLMIKKGDNYENSEYIKFVVDLIDKYYPLEENK